MCEPKSDSPFSEGRQTEGSHSLFKPSFDELIWKKNLRRISAISTRWASMHTTPPSNAINATFSVVTAVTATLSSQPYICASLKTVRANSILLVFNKRNHGSSIYTINFCRVYNYKFESSTWRQSILQERYLWIWLMGTKNFAAHFSPFLTSLPMCIDKRSISFCICPAGVKLYLEWLGHWNEYFIYHICWCNYKPSATATWNINVYSSIWLWFSIQTCCFSTFFYII